MKRLLGTLSVSSLFLSACASTSVWIATEGEVSLDREDLRELHEAFKTTSEKTITLDHLKKEVECDGHACPLEVNAKARYRRQDNSIAEKTSTRASCSDGMTR